jgi:phosphoribosylformylglycinamidine cyclo-ligase
MLRTFNCGIGMIVVAAQEHAEMVAAAFADGGQQIARLGTVVEAAGDRVAYAGHLAL